MTARLRRARPSNPMNCCYCDQIAANDHAFVRRAQYTAWGTLPPFIAIHRPLRDYVAACQAAGPELRDLDEPELSAEGRREFPAFYVRHSQRAPFPHVLRFVKKS